MVRVGEPDAVAGADLLAGRRAGEALGALTRLKSPGWIQMFQVAWMPPGFISPDDIDFEPAVSTDRERRLLRACNLGKASEAATSQSVCKHHCGYKLMAILEGVGSGRYI